VVDGEPSVTEETIDQGIRDDVSYELLVRPLRGVDQ